MVSVLSCGFQLRADGSYRRMGQVPRTGIELELPSSVAARGWCQYLLRWKVHERVQELESEYTGGAARLDRQRVSMKK